MINMQAVHLNPHIWPRPMKFDPLRFLPDPDYDDTQTPSPADDKNDNHKPIQPFTYLPFIAGPRNCLGQHLALLESKMVIALLLQRYDFALCPTKHAPADTIDAEDWSHGRDPRHRFMVPIIPKQELWVTVKRK
jgi:cytochrome P450